MPASWSIMPSRSTSEVRDCTTLARCRMTSRAALMSAGGMKLPRSSPHSSRCASHSASARSVLRPGTLDLGGDVAEHGKATTDNLVVVMPRMSLCDETLEGAAVGASL